MELAEATIKELQDYDVVMWEKHGVFAVDCDVMQAFDQIDVLNKSGVVYIAAKNRASNRWNESGADEGDECCLQIA